MNIDTPPEIILKEALLRFSRQQIAEALDIVPRTLARWEKGEGIHKRDVLSLLYLLEQNRNRAPAPMVDGFTFIDLFAGIGGTRMGFERNGGHCIFTSEWDEAAQRTYRANHSAGNHTMIGDIRQITAEGRWDLLPEHDVLVAGFPCQPFSIAGVSKKNSLGRAHGFACEAQGTLFFDIARILRERRPHAFLLENVKNLMSHDKGNTFRVIQDVLKNELGYTIFPKVADAKGFVPQHRERIYIVGFREEVDFSWEDFKAPDPCATTLKDILHPQSGNEKPEEPYTEGKKAKVNDKYTLSDKLWIYLQNYAKKHQEKGNGFGFGLVGPDSVTRTLSARYYKDGSEILVDQGRGRNPRRLTPRECARLMGFDTPERKFNIVAADTPAYKQFGNSVVVPVIAEIARIMKPVVMELKSKTEQRKKMAA